jgi:endo-1,4-beta-xylanase
MVNRIMLRTFAVVVISTIILGCTAFAAEGTEKEESPAPPKTAFAVKGTPVIDGKIDAIWAKAKPFVAETQSFTYVYHPSVCEAKVRTLWDDKNLYCLAEVKDPVISAVGIDPWERDSIEFVVDQSNNKKDIKHEFDTAGGQYRVDAVTGTISGRFYAFEKSFSEDKIIGKSVIIKCGYRVELAIPWTTLKGKVKVGTVVGFDLQINDDSGIGVRDGMVLWNSNNADSCWRTDLCGNLKLIAAPTAPKPTPKP